MISELEYNKTLRNGHDAKDLSSKQGLKGQCLSGALLKTEAHRDSTSKLANLA